MNPDLRRKVETHIHENYRPERATRLLEVLDAYGDELIEGNMNDRGERNDSIESTH